MLVLGFDKGHGVTIRHGAELAQLTIGRDADERRLWVHWQGTADATLDGHAEHATTFGIGDSSTVQIDGKNLVVTYLGRDRFLHRFGFDGPRAVAVLRNTARATAPKAEVTQ